ncbi:chitinase [Vigna unguiculata]|uniref:Chitinase n=2 Tax=Vigna unguiculata TaxID=3917 RepID=A0A4D6KV74_VIGUN|nr:chitinase [Vigna unguiculata]
MVYSNKFQFVVSFFLFMLHLHASTAQNIIGGYWFADSGSPAADINSTLFTHLFCAFADTNPTNFTVTISSSNSAKFSSFTQTVQQKNPSVKTLLSIGGGASNPSTFSAMASQPTSRKSFIDSAIQLARSNNFHGVDIDWEYPSTPSDMQNFGIFSREFRTSLISEARNSGKPILLLSCAVFRSSDYYSLEMPSKAMNDSFDIINVMSYDFHGPNWFPNRTAAPASLNYQTNSGAYQVGGDQGIRSWIAAGVSRRKLAMGIPYYGYAWRLRNGSNNGLYAPANGSAFGGDGSMGYNQIRAFVSQNGARCVYNSTLVTDYCYAGTTWIGYDDVQSVAAKVNYCKNNGLLGHFVWQVASDNNWALSQTGDCQKFLIPFVDT